MNSGEGGYDLTRRTSMRWAGLDAADEKSNNASRDFAESLLFTVFGSFVVGVVGHTSSVVGVVILDCISVLRSRRISFALRQGGLSGSGPAPFVGTFFCSTAIAPLLVVGVVSLGGGCVVSEGGGGESSVSVVIK